MHGAMHHSGIYVGGGKAECFSLVLSWRFPEVLVITSEAASTRLRPAKRYGSRMIFASRDVGIGRKEAPTTNAPPVSFGLCWRPSALTMSARVPGPVRFSLSISARLSLISTGTAWLEVPEEPPLCSTITAFCHPWIQFIDGARQKEARSGARREESVADGDSHPREEERTMWAMKGRGVRGVEGGRPRGHRVVHVEKGAVAEEHGAEVTRAGECLLWRQVRGRHHHACTQKHGQEVRRLAAQWEGGRGRGTQNRSGGGIVARA